MMGKPLTEPMREQAKANFHQAVGHQLLTRRDFMRGAAAGTAVLPIAAGMYFGYRKLSGGPVKAVRGLPRIARPRRYRGCRHRLAAASAL
jgi:hypothetical protein